MVAGAVAQAMARNLGEAERSVAALGDAMSSLRVLPGPSIVKAAARVEHQWRSIEDEFGLLDAADIGRRAGSRAVSTRAWASQKHRDRQILGVRRRNRVLYPGFQLDESGHIRPGIGGAIEIFTAAGWREEHVVLWFVAANGRLGGRRPVDVLASDDERVVAAARAAVDRW